MHANVTRLESNADADSIYYFLNHLDVYHICTPLAFIREDNEMPTSVSATAENAVHRKASHFPTIASPLSVTRVICAHALRQQQLPMLQLQLPQPLLC